MEKRIPVQQFDLQRFIEETRAFIKGRLTAEIDPSCEIPAIGEDDSVFEWVLPPRENDLKLMELPVRE